ncbi:MAG TPA: 3'(2'),5'-bisphosphate nucleotidase CysQ [Bacteroidales bacterium]|nr:3'(2'),5'-bisphosphate nucleotidase CysQ [Bacteroidales bacterium]
MRSELLEVSINAAVQAGVKIMEIFHDRIRIRIKRNLTPVTNADKAANQIITDTLSSFNIPLISEESVIPPYEERRTWNLFWLVDPLDGTMEFISRGRDFTVNIALLHNNNPVMGVIYAPAYDILYFAEEQTGSYKLSDAYGFVNSHQNGGMELLVSKSTRLPYTRTETYTFVTSRSHIDGRTRRYINNRQQSFQCLQKGSSLKLCALAEGVADEYPRFGKTMEWDIAAGNAILRLADGQIRNTIDGEPMKYNKEILVNTGFIAYSSIPV